MLGRRTEKKGIPGFDFDRRLLKEERVGRVRLLPHSREKTGEKKTRSKGKGKCQVFLGPGVFFTQKGPLGRANGGGGEKGSKVYKRHHRLTKAANTTARKRGKEQLSPLRKQ